MSITKQAAQQIIDLYLSGQESKDLAFQFSISHGTVTNIVGGNCKKWSSCHRPENIKDILAARKASLKQGWNDNKHKSYPDLTKRQIEIITGSMLGDGHITKTTPNSFFKKEQCTKFLDYLKWHQAELHPFSKSIGDVYSTEVFLGVVNGCSKRKKVDKYLSKHRIKTCCHPVFTNLRKIWYPKGKKIVPIGTILTPLTICVWFCDDGSLSGKHCRFSTESFTFEEVELLRSELDKFGIYSWVERKTSKTTGALQPIIRISNKSTFTLIDIVSSFMTWDCMDYKIKVKNAS